MALSYPQWPILVSTLRRLLDIDALPIDFPVVAVDIESRKHLLKAINELAESIWIPSQYRFWHNNKGFGLKFSYYCCQDQENNKTDLKKRTASHRDRDRMERFLL